MADAGWFDGTAAGQHASPNESYSCEAAKRLSRRGQLGAQNQPNKQLRIDDQE
jgi:hypothetical protein